MKFTASSADLLRALTTVSGAVPAKSTMAVLECILFTQEDDHLKLTATDLEISIVQTVPVHFESTGGRSRIAVPAKRLLDTLRALPALPISFSADDEFHITLKTDQGVYKMVGLDGADYPALPEVSHERSIVLGGAVLRRAIQITSFAVSKDALRPAMMGIYFQVKDAGSRMVSTDGHRLVRLTLDELRGDITRNFIVPEKALALAARVAGEESCTISVDDSYAAFTLGASLVMTRLVDENYPNYEAVIPVENDRRLIVNRDAMLAAVKRVGLYSSSMTNQIRLSLDTNRLEISAEDIERSSEARETVLCEYDGEPMVIGFNSVYLTEVISHIAADDIVFELSTPNRAGIVTPLAQREGEDLLMLIMPVMLNTYA
jgi:DNA polymerase-3 subunit beta